MPNKYLDSVGLAEYTGLVKDYVDTKADDYLPLAGGTLTGNVYTTPYYDSTIVDPEGGQTLVVCKGKVAKGTAPSSNEWHTMVMAVDNSGSTNNANKYGQIETGVKTDGSVETTVQTYKNEANSTTSAKISVGYDANGNVFTSAPTPTAGDNSTKIATTAFVNTAMANGYLPLSGGTMTGAIERNGVVIKNTGDNGAIQILAGTDTTSSYITVYGKSSSNPGLINIRAYDGTNSKYLTLASDGTCTWGGKNVESVESSGSDYIRYTNGVQICKGYTGSVSSSETTVTYPQPFNSAPQVTISTNTLVNIAVRSINTTTFKVLSASGSNIGVRYIAFGYWK